MKILILASNPRKDLNLDREIRDLREVIEKSQNREKLEVADELAVRVQDLQDLLFRHRPQIVHFCGHGSGKHGLVFEGQDGEEQWVRTEALSDLFRLFSTDIGCVLLNACYSEEQANAIVAHIDYVIGMRQEIQDNAAIAFATGFYRALSYKTSIEEAYEFGCNAIQLEIWGSSVVRSTATEAARKLEVVSTASATIIPEHLKPVLRKKERGLRTHKWEMDTCEPFSPKSKEELQWELAQALLGTSSGKNLLIPHPPTAGDTSRPSYSNQKPTALSAHFTQFLLGCLAVSALLAIGIYSYRQWQWQQPDQVFLRQAIELAQQQQWEAAIATLGQISTSSPIATQSQTYLATWSGQLLELADESYQEGNIDKAIKYARAIPESSPIYSQTQAAIVVWQQDKQKLEEIDHILATSWDLDGARRLLNKIQSSGLRKQAENNINETNSKVQAAQVKQQENKTAPIPPISSALPLPRPESPQSPPDPLLPSKPSLVPLDWQDYRYGWLSDRSVTETDLVGKSPLELDIMRNAILAKYGQRFTRSDLQEEFSQQSWYHPTEQAVEDLVTPQEWANFTTICQFQQQRNLSVRQDLQCKR